MECFTDSVTPQTYQLLRLSTIARMERRAGRRALEESSFPVVMNAEGEWCRVVRVYKRETYDIGVLEVVADLVELGTGRRLYPWGTNIGELFVEVPVDIPPGT